jgi:hypothetical protein
VQPRSVQANLLFSLVYLDPSADASVDKVRLNRNTVVWICRQDLRCVVDLPRGSVKHEVRPAPDVAFDVAAHALLRSPSGILLSHKTYPEYMRSLMMTEISS